MDAHILLSTKSYSRYFCANPMPMPMRDRLPKYFGEEPNPNSNECLMSLSSHMGCMAGNGHNLPATGTDTCRNTLTLKYVPSNFALLQVRLGVRLFLKSRIGDINPYTSVPPLLGGDSSDSSSATCWNWPTGCPIPCYYAAAVTQSLISWTSQ